MSENTIGTAYIQIEPSFKGVTPKIEQEMSGAGSGAGGKFGSGFVSSVGGAIGKMGAVVGTGALAAVGAAGAAVVKYTKDATAAFGSYQQLVGGVETLFGAGGAKIEDYLAEAAAQGIDAATATEQFNQKLEAQQTVLDNASKAYKTAGMSTNEYMETVTSFSASLIGSLEGDTMAAATAADQAIIDMADNANKMGTPIESIQNAYQGFAKQNYTMLDNLKLGYGGTKTEMERLLSDAEQLAGLDVGTLNIDSFADVTDAIHIIQENMGISGTTSEEAASTIEGSMHSVKASWDNLITGIGSGDDLTPLINNFLDEATVFADNMIPTIQTSLDGISAFISTALPKVIDKVLPIITSNAPKLLTAAVSIAESVITGLTQAIPQLAPTLISLIGDLATMLVGVAPQLAQGLFDLAGMAVMELINNLPQIVTTLIDWVCSALEFITQPEVLSKIIEGVAFLVVQVTIALAQALPRVLQCFVSLIQNIAATLAPYLAQAGAWVGQIFSNIVAAISSWWGGIVDTVTGIASAAVNGFVSFWLSLPSNIAYLCGAVISTIISFWANLPSTIGNIASQAIAGFIKFWTTLPSKIATVCTNVINAVLAWKNNLIAKATEIASGFADKLVNGLKALPEKMLSIGRNIVDGIKKGISDAWANMTGWIGDLCDSFVKGFTDKLDIHSPSRRLANEVGRHIPSGIALGITKGMDALTKVIDDVSATIVADSRPEITSNYVYRPAGNTGDAQAVALLAKYLPIIASGEHVNIALSPDMARIYKAMRVEARREAELVGNEAKLAY